MINMIIFESMLYFMQICVLNLIGIEINKFVIIAVIEISLFKRDKVNGVGILSKT